MRIGNIIGQVVSTRKDIKLEGIKLLIVQPVDINEKPLPGEYIIAVDTVQAGTNDRVIVVQGSSARMAEGMEDRPVDASIIGIVDSMDIEK
ncbi:MAG: EutN/CcmL family microcompartment protein [Acidobacteria bacterium]|nr:EutN/CcmL family microcompartment protein [Acidobacteriota bacterium]